jgi:2-keto-4-pentenoate hydratase/2-oxohepta-3-ene-1,7-dioic acid hydratase in catechol pathway
MTWSLVAVTSDAGVRTAALAEDGTVRVIEVLPRGVTPMDVVEHWEDHAEALRAWNIAGGEILPDVSIEQPLRYPRKVICIGANYRDHRKEMEAEAEGAKAKPFFFLKPPTTTLIGTGEDIRIRSVDDRVDWEAEIAIVLAKGGRFIRKEDALACIAGITLANDVSARGVHHQPHAVAPPFSYDWLASKSQDGFCPIGPGIVPLWFVDDVEDVPFALSVNGEVQQSSTTAYTITGILDQIVAASEWMTLEPGDVILTGTPGGVGVARGLFLKDGDEVVVSSPLIGKLVNTVRVIER